jgi:hypothetical protein
MEDMNKMLALRQLDIENSDHKEMVDKDLMEEIVG